jgi:hypothetical protein
MSSLTDRYLAATLNAVPADRRDEIATELRGSIEDMIEGRTATGRESADAEREVLTELGDPAQLAARYADRRLQLIGPTYYLAWARLLKLLLVLVPAPIGLLVGVVEAADGVDAGAAVGQGIAAAFGVAVQITFWVTLVFAVLERTGTAADLPAWTVDRLPESRAARQITLADTAVAIGFLVLVIAYLLLQQFRSFVPTDGDGNLPVLDPALWSGWLPLLIAVLVASVVLEVVKYRTGHWTWPLVAANAVLDVAFAGSLVWLLLTDRLLNPELALRFEWLQEGDNLDTLTTVTVVATVLIVLWDIADSCVKAYRNRG